MSICWVFVYDNYVNPALWPRLSGDAKPALLSGFQRTWNIARDNSISLVGDRGFIEPRSQLKPPIAITYPNIRAKRGGKVNGMLLPIEERHLKALDSHYRLYERIMVNEKISPTCAEEIWTWRGRAHAEDCYKRFHRQGHAILVASVVAETEAAFAQHGEAALDAYKNLTDTPLLPVLALTPLS